MNDRQVIFGTLSLEQAKWLHDQSFIQKKPKIVIIRDLITKEMLNQETQTTTQ